METGRQRETERKREKERERHTERGVGVGGGREMNKLDINVLADNRIRSPQDERDRTVRQGKIGSKGVGGGGGGRQTDRQIDRQTETER